MSARAPEGAGTRTDGGPGPGQPRGVPVQEAPDAAGTTAATVEPAESVPTPAAPIRPAPRRPAHADVLAIRASCAAVAERPVRLAETFYDHLFEIAPPARDLFPADMTDQMQKMTDTLLGAITTLLDDGGPGSPRVAALEATLRHLGAVHRISWGIAPEHYLYIAHALTRAVRDVAGPVWCGGLSSSWIALTQWITEQMLAGAADPLATGRA